MKEFIKKLSVETSWSYEDSESFVKFINDKVGNIKTAKEIYERDGVYSLIIYGELLRLRATY